VVVGAVAVQLMGVSTRFVAQWTDLPSDLVANLRLALIGLLLVIMILYRPQGLFPEKKATFRARGR
jgi:branched-chain amino acid transport system permease protein